MKRALLCIYTLLLASCADSNEQPEEVKAVEHFYAPKSGTIIAADSFKIAEDKLNDFYYAAKIVSTDFSDEGKYLLHAHWGLNVAVSDIIYPSLQQKIIPAIERDDTHPYAYIIGFKYENDNAFHDYARITATKVSPIKSEIELRYIKSYYIDSVEKK